MNLNRVKNVFISIILFSIALICIVNQDRISSAVYTSISRCVKQIVPSLFAMSVLTGIMQRCGVIEKLFNRLNINTQALCCLLFGNIGGYPIGAKTVSDMINQGKISKDNAEKIICFSFSCGPAFALGISYVVYGNSVCGLAAFASILISNLILYLIYSYKNKTSSKHKPVNHQNFSTKLVVDCVLNSTNAMLLITAMIALFSVFSEAARIYTPQIFVSIIPSILEISNIISLSSIPLPCLTFLLSLGGLCVLVQISAIVNSSFSLKRFYLTRILHVTFATLVSSIFDFVFNLSGYVNASNTSHIYLSQSDSIIPLLCVVSMISIVFLTKTKQRTV